MSWIRNTGSSYIKNILLFLEVNEKQGGLDKVDDMENLLISYCLNENFQFTMSNT
jgi:hypothetical protein